MSITTPLEIHHRISASGQSALEVLASLEQLAANDLLTCFQHGAVWLEASGKPRRLYDSGHTVQSGQTLHLYCNDSTLAPCPYQPQLVEDHAAFSIWYKPAGMLSQGSKWGDHWTLQRWIKQQHWPERDSLIAHRLDRFTQGLMIVTHDDAINRAFHRLFEQRQIKKTYRAIVCGPCKHGQHWRIDAPIDGRAAVSEIRLLASDPDRQLCLLEIEPQTGRKHQIRVHLSGAGLPIVNDRQYGHGPFNGDIALQACALDFDNPVNVERVSVRLNGDRLLALPNEEPGI